MATDNQVTLVGNLTDDPELRYTPNGAAVCKFRIAVNRRFQDANGQWKDGDTSYFTINAWRTMAENAAAIGLVILAGAASTRVRPCTLRARQVSAP